MFSWFKLLIEKMFKKQKELDTLPEVEEVVPDFSGKLLSPIRHKRYLTCYYIPKTLSLGDIPVKDKDGNIITHISEHSKKRLDMEGTGRLPDGRLLNYWLYINGEVRYIVLDQNKYPYGMGIKEEPLVPKKSLAANITQIKEHNLFGRKVIIPYLHNEKLLGDVGDFEIHDTGSAMRRCPFEGGLWRSGYKNRDCGQFDVFVGDYETYKKIANKWHDYDEVIVLPRDLESSYGIQETINLLLDKGLVIDGVIGPKTKEGIKGLQKAAGLEETGEWSKNTKRFAELSLKNWDVLPEMVRCV